MISVVSLMNNLLNLSRLKIKKIYIALKISRKHIENILRMIVINSTM
jgi:hypothetical protein